MKASDLFVRCLEAEGVEYVFGVPGEENLDMLDSLRNSSIKLILTRHEQAAGFMAATYGRFTGKAGVCMSTLGPGATNLVTAAAYSNLGAMPMLMITGQKPIKQSKQGQFQIVDIVDTMQPLTKYTRQVPSADKIPSLVREAFRMAEEERPGAVHLEFPEDVAAEHSEAGVIMPNPVRRPIAEGKAISRAIGLLQNARSPLLLVGAAANRKMTCRMLRQFVDETGIPFFSTQMGEGVIDEEHPLFIGNAALSANDFLHRAIDAADLILNVGHDVVEKPPFFMHGGGAKVVHVNFSSAIVDDVYFPQVEVVGDIANSIWQIKEGITAQPHWDFEFFLKVRERINAHTEQYAHDGAYPMRPARIVSDVREVMPDDGIVCLDNGVYKIWFSRNYPAKLPNTLLLDNALATMGAGLPSAMAAWLVKPDKHVLAVCGDGGFMMNSQELETAVRLKMHITVLILRDDAYGMIKWKQADMGFENFGLDYGNPDFVKYAEAYGARGHRVERSDDLVKTLESCFQEHAVHVVDLPVDYSENDRILNREIRELSRELRP